MRLYASTLPFLTMKEACLNCQASSMRLSCFCSSKKKEALFFCGHHFSLFSHLAEKNRLQIMASTNRDAPFFVGFDAMWQSRYCSCYKLRKNKAWNLCAPSQHGQIIKVLSINLIVLPAPATQTRDGMEAEKEQGLIEDSLWRYKKKIKLELQHGLQARHNLRLGGICLCFSNHREEVLFLSRAPIRAIV